MQHQIAGAVGRWIGSPPNLFFGKLLQGFYDAREILFDE
jgi:hypothetical protein